VQLIGGDTTRGPLNLTLQIHGLLPAGQALRRDAARPGDLIGVTGTLGDAGLALRGGVGSAEDDAYLQRRLDCPEPRIEAGRALLGLAHAAIDVSDGLLADLGHICERSRVGATLDLDRLPLSPPVSRHLQKSADWALPLASGDDYELCVTVPAERREEAQAQVARSGDRLTWIGVVEAESGIRCRQANGDLLQFAAGGYTHFQSP
jgi:thiamine-monophosphate kinase